MHSVLVIMPLAERWNGVAWSLLPLPSVPLGTQDAGLEAVSCTSPGACEVVGGFSGKNGAQGLFAERWDGSSWSLESVPNPVPAANISQQGTFFNSMSLACSSASLCTAVGGYDLNTGRGQSFAERWDGSRWSLEATLEIPGAFDTQLASVSCPSPSVCVAVGYYDPRPGPSQRTLAERWNGTSWSVDRTLDPAGQSSELDGVSCTSSACLAVGQTRVNTGSGFQPLVERRDGTRWSIERTPLSDGLVAAVSCTSTVICTVFANPPRGPVVAEQSAPASAKLSGIPAACASGRLTMHVTGVGISSVTWSLDHSRLEGHVLHRGTRYAASTRLAPGTHKLTAKVKFTASSQTHAHTFRRDVRGCTHVP
jgi:hypothetical protein